MNVYPTVWYLCNSQTQDILKRKVGLQDCTKSKLLLSAPLINYEGFNLNVQSTPSASARLWNRPDNDRMVLKWRYPALTWSNISFICFDLFEKQQDDAVVFAVYRQVNLQSRKAEVIVCSTGAAAYKMASMEDSLGNRIPTLESCA